MIYINADNPEYLNIINKDKEISNFVPKLEMVNKWVIDELKEFFQRIQWISAGAISLSVPLLINQNIKKIKIFSYKNIIFDNYFVLSLSWISFILSFFFALYRNKLHPEYIHYFHLADWQRLNEEKLELSVKALNNKKNIDEKNQILKIKDDIHKFNEKTLKKKNCLWMILIIFEFLSQLFLIIGVLFFVIFGIITLNN
jgi:hypothetical protein